jgi:hypothetical protein
VQLEPVKPSYGPVSGDAPHASCLHRKIEKEWLIYASGGTVTVDALNEIDEADETNNTYFWSSAVPRAPNGEKRNEKLGAAAPLSFSPAATPATGRRLALPHAPTPTPTPPGRWC